MILLAAAQLLSPALLGWAALPGLLAVALYLFKRRPRQVRVSTLPFFKSLAAIYQESAWLRRLKKLISFLLTALMILGPALALAHLVVAPKVDELRGVVLLIDGSASMGARAAGGPTRLEEGQRWARERLAGLPPGVAVMVVRYDRRPEILLPFSYDRRAVERALQAVTVRPLPGDPRAALALADRLAALEAPAEVWHLTDQPPARLRPRELSEAAPVDSAAETAPLQSATRGVTHRLVDLGLPTPRNVGITALQVRPRPLEHGKVEAFVELQGAPVGEEPYETQLEVLREGELVLLQRLEVPAGGVERLLLPLDAALGERVTIQIRADGDVLASDDLAPAVLPEARPVRVAWVTPEGDPFTQLALAAIQAEGQLEVFQVPPQQWPLPPGADGRPPFQVALFDGWLPERWDPNLPAFVIDPPVSLGPVRVARLETGLALSGLRSVAEQHPLLYGVASGRVAPFQTCVLEAGGGLTPLWVGPAGPVLSAGEVGGQRVIVGGFSTLRSERLGYLASWPLLLGNAVLWLARPGEEASARRNHTTGELLELAPGERLEWEGSPTESPAARLVELDRVGLFRCGERQGATALLSSLETNLRAQDSALEAAPAAAIPLADYLRGDLRALLLWLALLALVGEAWLLHRWGVF